MTDGDRIDIIRERLEMTRDFMLPAIPTPALNDIKWLLDKLDEAHKMYYQMRSDYEMDKEEIYRLRDEVNALWDVVWSLTNGDEEVDKASEFFLERYNVQKVMRTGERIALERRASLEELIELSEDLPGGYLGDK